MKLVLMLLGLVGTALAATTADHNKVVGCYWGTWSFYRKDSGQYDVDDFDPSLCTHGFYGFADLNNQTWEISAFDPWYDLAPEDCGAEGSTYCHFDSYRRFVALADDNPKFHPILSLGRFNYLNINKLGVTFFNKVKHISGTKHQTQAYYTNRPRSGDSGCSS